MEEKLKLYDDISWSYEYALNTYIKLSKKEISELTDSDYSEIYECAGVHIAFFITWLVKKNYQSNFFTDDAVQKLRNEEIKGTDFLKEYCDGKLVSDMMKDEIIPFVNKFYNDRYFNMHYVPWVMKILHDLPLEFGWNWNDYRKYENYMTNKYKGHIRSEKRYKEFLKSIEKKEDE